MPIFLKTDSPLAAEAKEDEKESSEKTTKAGTEHNHRDEIFPLKLVVAGSFRSGGSGCHPGNSHHQGNG